MQKRTLLIKLRPRRQCTPLSCGSSVQVATEPSLRAAADFYRGPGAPPSSWCRYSELSNLPEALSCLGGATGDCHCPSPTPLPPVSLPLLPLSLPVLP